MGRVQTTVARWLSAYSEAKSIAMCGKPKFGSYLVHACMHGFGF